MAPQGMTEGFLRRSLIASGVIGLLAAIFTARYAGISYAGIYTVCVVWAVTNLLIWGISIRELLGPRRPIVMFPFFTAKLLWIGVLFALCYAMGVREWKWGQFLSFLLGFLTPLLVMFLKALGVVLTQNRQSGGKTS